MKFSKILGRCSLVALGSLAVLGAKGDLTPALDEPSPKAQSLIATFADGSQWAACRERQWKKDTDWPPLNELVCDRVDWLAKRGQGGKDVVVKIGNRWAHVHVRTGEGKPWVKITGDMSYSDAVHINRAARKLYDELMAKQHKEAIPEEFR